jgi:hypothetical protein
MRIHQLLGPASIMVTNEEKKFINSHSDTISLTSLNDHEMWLAQNLVRKNVYQLTNDNKNIVINKGHENQ